MPATASAWLLGEIGQVRDQKSRQAPLESENGSGSIRSSAIKHHYSATDSRISQNALRVRHYNLHASCIIARPFTAQRTPATRLKVQASEMGPREENSVLTAIIFSIGFNPRACAGRPTRAAIQFLQEVETGAGLPRFNAGRTAQRSASTSVMSLK